MQLTTCYLLGLSSSIQDVMGVIRFTDLEDARKMPCCLKQRILRLGLRRRLLTPRAASISRADQTALHSDNGEGFSNPDGI